VRLPSAGIHLDIFFLTPSRKLHVSAAQSMREASLNQSIGESTNETSMAESRSAYFLDERCGPVSGPVCSCFFRWRKQRLGAGGNGTGQTSRF
jgi:hypothetical protein